MDNLELKDFIAIQMGQLTQEISRLAATVDRQSTMMRDIDIKTTTRIAELQKDVEEIRRDLVEVRGEVRDVSESQKVRWRAHDEERAAEKKAQDTKDRMQAVKNNQMDTVNKLLWAIFSTVLVLFIGFLWQVLINGGLKGLIVP